MTKAEYDLVKDFTYIEFVEYLNLKYGEVKGPYFHKTKNDTLIINEKIKRSEEGLFIHHVKEDRVAHLSTLETASVRPYSYQEARNLVYCDYLEHLYLHTLILESPKGFGEDGHSIGNRVYQDIELIYEYPHLVKGYETKARDRIIDNKDAYKIVKDRYLKALNKEPKLDSKYLLLKKQGEQRDYIHTFYSKYEDYTYRVNGRGQIILLKLTSVSMIPTKERETTIKYVKVETLKSAKYTTTLDNGQSYNSYGLGEKVSEEEKTIRLTNKKLESLNQDKDQDIATLAPEIIDSLHIETLIPSWYKIAKVLEKEEEELEEATEYIAKSEADIKITQNSINSLQNRLENMINQKENNNVTYKVYEQNLKKKFLKIITFNIYPHTLKKKMVQLNLRNSYIDESIKEVTATLESLNEFIATLPSKLEHYQKERDSIKTKYASIYERIIPLA